MDPGPRRKQPNKIFVGGLHWETTDDKLRRHFCLFGEVTDAVVMKDPVSRRSRGFGFITFADAAAVDRVLSQDNHILDSRRVEAKRAVPRAETLREQAQNTPPMHSMGLSPPNMGIPALLGNPAPYLPGPSVPHPQNVHSPLSPNKIFVGGLHYETKDPEFRAYFEQFGRVVSAEVMFNRETHKSRGFGFVTFEDEQCVEHVLATPQHSIDGKLVEVKRAIPRNSSPSGRGMSPSYGGMGGPHGRMAHGGGSMNPPSLNLNDRSQYERPGYRASYAAVLRRQGGRQMDGDMPVNEFSGLSLRAAQEQQALGLERGPYPQTNIDVLESSEGEYSMSHMYAAQQQHLRDQQPLMAAPQYYGGGEPYLQQSLNQLATMDESVLASQYSYMGHRQAAQQATRPPAAQAHNPYTDIGGFPTAGGIGSGLLPESSTSTSRFPFASAGGAAGPSSSASPSLLWPASSFAQGTGDALDGGPTHPPSALPAQQAPPPPQQSSAHGPHAPPPPPNPHQHPQQGQGPGQRPTAGQQGSGFWDHMLYPGATSGGGGGGGGGGQGGIARAGGDVGATSAGLPSVVQTASMSNNMAEYGGTALNGYTMYPPSGLDPRGQDDSNDGDAGHPASRY